MREHSTVNFLVKALFACSAKVASSVRARCDGVSLLAEESPLQGTSTPRNGSWHLYISSPYISRSGNQIGFSAESFSIHVDRFPSSWRSL
jgi:hypothetical protein